MQSLPIIELPRQISAPNAVEPARSKGSYCLVSLGCPKNLVDSERMLGLLELDGYHLVADPVGSDFVIVNTCGFIENARAESLATIDEMIGLKRRGATGGLIVSGCLAERDRQSLLERYPEIDQLVGVFGRDEVSKAADRLLGNLHEQRTLFRPMPARPLPDTGRLRITPRHLAYLKISEGCDRLCTFCAIPKMRGRHASKPIEEVVAEARELAADGVRELNIVAQDTTYYGLDLYGRPRLAELLTQLDQIDGFDWIRVLYVYPMYVDDRLIDVLASAEKIVPYIDMPLQHINDRMLRRMQRRVNRAGTEELIGRLRSAIADLTLRTTFITGFPGETDAEFDELLGFVRAQKFERLGVFTYSREPNTPADRLDGHLPDEVKNDRRDRLMAAQQQVAFAWNESQIGRRVDVLLDTQVPGEQAWIGRTCADAPEIDGVVYVSGDNLRPGQLVACEIVASKEYDLIGVAVDEPR